jgi:hypothetical protein
MLEMMKKFCGLEKKARDEFELKKNMMAANLTS